MHSVWGIFLFGKKRIQITKFGFHNPEVELIQDLDVIQAEQLSCNLDFF